METKQAIASRNFVNPHSGTVTMIPIADMFNHNVPASLFYSWSREESKEGIRFHAEREIAQGEEVFITYGDTNTNDYLLAHYGFVLPENPNKMKVSLKRESSDKGGLDVNVDFNSPTVQETLSNLRLSFLSERHKQK